MTSTRRAYYILVCTVVAAVALYGTNVQTWTAQAIFGLVGVAASTLVAALSKSPRDAAISDGTTPASTPPTPAAVVAAKEVSAASDAPVPAVPI